MVISSLVAETLTRRIELNLINLIIFLAITENDAFTTLNNHVLNAGNCQNIIYGLRKHIIIKE